MIVLLYVHIWLYFILYTRSNVMFQSVERPRVEKITGSKPRHIQLLITLDIVLLEDFLGY